MAIGSRPLARRPIPRRRSWFTVCHCATGRERIAILVRIRGATATRLAPGLLDVNGAGA